MSPATRRNLAITSLVVALFAQAGLPALHALVHRLEALVAHHDHGPRWRVERTPDRAARHGHGHAHDHRGDRDHGHRHQHPGDAPGEHGAAAPEHLEAALASPPPTILPIPLEHELATAPPGALASLDDARVPSTDRNRGPPPVA